MVQLFRHTAQPAGELDIKQIVGRMVEFRKTLAAVKRQLAPTDFSWYPYDSLTNFFPLEQLLRGGDRFLLDLVGSDPVLDIGCGDGDVSFFLESLGCALQSIDNPPTNFNRMQGVQALKTALNSSVEIFEMDIDARFEPPRDRYGLAVFFGTLYHLKNPYYALETLAKHARYGLVSTRVARVSPDKRTNFQKLPVAYLLDEMEANGDATNYWIFSEAGLRRILTRAGWDVREYITTGYTLNSDPANSDADERAFCFLKSRNFG